MESKFTYRTNAECHQNKKYRKLMAQIIKNNVKKKILEIRRRGIPAAAELFDMMIEKLQEDKRKSRNTPIKCKKQSVGKTDKGVTSLSKSFTGSCERTESAERKSSSRWSGTNNSEIYNKIAATIAEGIALADKMRSSAEHAELTARQLLILALESNRSKWIELLCQIASEQNAESLACFGTNLIYGGFLTETEGNCSKCRFIDFSDVFSSDRHDKLISQLKDDSSKGIRICILSGSNLFSSEMTKIYRYFSDTAFILIENGIPNANLKCEECEINNALYTGRSLNKDKFSTQKSGILDGIIEICDDESSSKRAAVPKETSGSLHTVSAGKGSSTTLSYGGDQRLTGELQSLIKYISSPSLPIILNSDQLYSIICEVEGLLSDGVNKSPNRSSI